MELYHNRKGVWKVVKNKKNGFTLVELLAVIVILAIVLVIAVPKVMNVIEDSKKATLESTAKMIASSAEKAKMQNNLLGDTEDITCESVAKLNNQDYALCNIEFEGNIAKVTIEGSGKFDGLNVCDGTKTSAQTVNGKCGVLAFKYITKLLKSEETLNNGLVQTYATINGETIDAGIRYAGPLTGENSVKNQIYFNCKDKDSNNVNYGEENYNYANSCEIWRIIGVFDTKLSESETETPVKRVKIVRDAFSIGMSWDSSSAGTSGIDNNNNGYGINEWSQADIQSMLNGYYIGKEGATCVYCNRYNQVTCSNDCSNSVGQLSSISLNMIDDALWYTGTPTYNVTLPLSTMYEGERSAQSGKICTSGNDCNDKVERTTTWVGKIGLIYPSDYAYASTDTSCARDIFGSDSTCAENNWLHPSSGRYWTISPRPDASRYASDIWIVNSSDRMSRNLASEAHGIRPTLYLSSNIKIIGGNGNTEPYILK